MLQVGNAGSEGIGYLDAGDNRCSLNHPRRSDPVEKARIRSGRPEAKKEEMRRGGKTDKTAKYWAGSVNDLIPLQRFLGGRIGGRLEASRQG